MLHPFGMLYGKDIQKYNAIKAQRTNLNQKFIGLVRQVRIVRRV